MANAAGPSNSDNAPVSQLLPIRVDVISEDRTLRIVDTLLLDPTCWPVTLYDPLFEAIEENVTLMAHTILSDAEVMVRRGWSVRWPSLIIGYCHDGSRSILVFSKFSVLPFLSVFAIQKSQGMGRTIRHFTGRVDLWTSKLQAAVEDQLRPQLWIAATRKEQYGATTTTKNIPISIRLVVDKVVLHEDILWDPNGKLSPLDFAKDMARELNLPEEATVAIATTIVEQIHGLQIDSSPDPTLASPNTNSNDPASTMNGISNSNNTDGNAATAPRKPPRGAWTIDVKEQMSMASQIVAQHRSI